MKRIKRWKCSACDKRFHTHLEGMQHIEKRHPPARLLYETKYAPVSRAVADPAFTRPTDPPSANFDEWFVPWSET